MTTNEKLRQIMASRNLSRKDVAAATYSTVHCVHSWLRRTSDPSFRMMPMAKFELLVMKLEANSEHR